MIRHRLKISSMVLVVVVIFSFGFAGEVEGWYEFDEGMTHSVKESKPVFIDFYTDWCHWCKVLDEKTFSDVDVQKYMEENFVKIKVNAEDRRDEQTYNGITMSSAELAKAFGVTGYPALAFLDKEQKLVTLVPGFLPPERFIHVLKYMKEECYTKDVSFEDFMKKGCED